VSTTDAFLAPVATEVLLTALARLRSEGPPASLKIGSPWLSDVPLFPGIFAGSFPFLLPGVEPTQVASILSFLRTWIKSGGTATILVQTHAPNAWPKKGSARYNEQELQLLQIAIDSGAEVLIAGSFHDKFVLVPDVVISGSANVTYSGLYINRERLSIHNQSSAPQDFSTSRAVCENHLATARAAGVCQPPQRPTGVANGDTVSAIRACYGPSWT
jgi:hypothetical protein